MNRVNINLLPAQILEKRKSEKIISLIVMATVGVFCAVFVGFLYTFSLVDAEVGKLEELKAENVQYEQEIAKIADFESNKMFVEERAQLVESAVANKYSLSKWLNNLSLLMPNEVWLTSLDIKDKGTVDFKCMAYADTDSRDLGQKSVAKWLVRLAEIDDLTQIWLNQSIKIEGAPREPLANGSAASLNTRDKMQFDAKAVIAPLAGTSAGGSAPPNLGGKI